LISFPITVLVQFILDCTLVVLRDITKEEGAFPDLLELALKHYDVLLPLLVQSLDIF
jgi:hypothetical protein